MIITVNYNGQEIDLFNNRDFDTWNTYENPAFNILNADNTAILIEANSVEEIQKMIDESEDDYWTASAFDKGGWYGAEDVTWVWDGHEVKEETFYTNVGRNEIIQEARKYDDEITSFEILINDYNDVLRKVLAEMDLFF